MSAGAKSNNHDGPNHYDVAVIGAGLSGLAAGARLALISVLLSLLALMGTEWLGRRTSGRAGP